MADLQRSIKGIRLRLTSTPTVEYRCRYNKLQTASAEFCAAAVSGFELITLITAACSDTRCYIFKMPTNARLLHLKRAEI